MRKVLVVLTILLLFSCEKDDDVYDCECVKSVYSVELNPYDYDDFTLTLIEEYEVECSDEISYKDYNNNLVVINCY